MPAPPSHASVDMAAGLTVMSAAVAALASRADPPPPVVHVDVAPAAVHLAPVPAAASVVQVDVHIPEPAAPVVNVTNDVQPAPVTVNNTHPARAVQTVQRDANDEIVSTTTTYEQE